MSNGDSESNGHSDPSQPQWDGQRWRLWDGRQWLFWDGDKWVPWVTTEPPVAAPNTIPASRRGVPTWLTVVGLLVLLSALTLGIALITQGGSNTSTGSTQSTGLSQVTYSVTGSSSEGTITYTTNSGTEQASAGPPWSRDLAIESGTFVYISAQNGSEFGSVTCTITVDGIVVSTNTSTADYGIAQCEGTA